MKILILSCGTGEGHNSAAKAIKEAAELKGHEAVIVDPNSIRSKHSKKVVDGAYNNLIRFYPKAFGTVYGLGMAVDNSKIPDPVYWFNSLYTRKMAEFITENLFDAVICTHLFGMEIMTALRRKKLLSIPFFCVQTDYTYTPFFKSIEPDIFFIPHKDLIPLYTGKGFSEDVLAPLGIPVAKRFRDPISKEEARKELQVPMDARMILIMSGGIGVGNLPRSCRYIQELKDPDLVCFALVGRNAELKRKIDEHYKESARMNAIMFTDRVNVFLKAADVVITKAGGLSTSEAASIRVPLVHRLDLPGCETANVEFFSSRGMSRFAKTEQEAVRTAHELTLDQAACETMIRAQKENINKDAAPDILERVIEYVIQTS